MKNLFLTFLVFCLTHLVYSQNIITKTPDGKSVLLKPDKTWEYIEDTNKTVDDTCSIPENYVEPKSDKKTENWLKRTDATTTDLKKHVAVENECKVEDVILLEISEQLGNGMYVLCVKGHKMKYRRTGSVFSRLDEDILKPR